MEFLVGLLCFVGGFAAVIAAVRRGGAWSRALLWVATALQAGVLASLAFDWGHSWVERTALQLILEQNTWLAIPHGLAFICLVGLLRWGFHFAPWASLLSAIQALVFIPVLLSVERNTSMSFLAPAPMVTLFAATLSSFLFLPMACRVVPDKDSRWHRIAFGPRESLIASVAGLRELGLAVRAPGSVLESGAASGRLGRVEVEVSTSPALFPPAYRLHVRLRPAPGAGALSMPGRPGFAPRETLRPFDGGLEYEGSSPAAFAVEPEGLRTFLRGLAGVGEAQPDT